MQNKGLSDIIGIRVFHCSRRNRERTIFDRNPPANTHSELAQLVYVTAGKIAYKFSDESFVAAAGDVILGEHAKLIERSSADGTPVSFYLMSFTPVNINGVVPFDSLGLPRLSQPDNAKAFVRDFSKLNKVFLKKSTGWMFASSMIAFNLISAITTANSLEPRDVSEPDDRKTEKRIRDVLDYINRNYKNKMGIAELAKMANLNAVHFNRLFKRMTGLSPHRYIMEKKISKAKDFLLRHNESLTTTAVELGFHDYSHFSRVFISIVGETPGKFIKKS